MVSEIRAGMMVPVCLRKTKWRPWVMDKDFGASMIHRERSKSNAEAEWYLNRLIDQTLMPRILFAPDILYIP